MASAFPSIEAFKRPENEELDPLTRFGDLPRNTVLRIVELHEAVTAYGQRTFLQLVGEDGVKMTTIAPSTWVGTVVRSGIDLTADGKCYLLYSGMKDLAGGRSCHDYWLARPGA